MTQGIELSINEFKSLMMYTPTRKKKQLFSLLLSYYNILSDYSPNRSFNFEDTKKIKRRRKRK